MLQDLDTALDLARLWPTLDTSPGYQAEAALDPGSHLSMDYTQPAPISRWQNNLYNYTQKFKVSEHPTVQ